ncbi:SprT family zinc-dependent metalloprotease [Pseudomonas sp. F1_0610]|uniref:SprT family zinc-dependent metalloprotease n=1 Tax=Pseudomonas sp. F1_0610 TaxID=3114284 RepID=UPI0039C4B0E2
MPELLKARVENCYKTAEGFFNRSFSRPKIELNLTGQKAGMAYLQANKLRFNQQLYQENQAHFLQQTVAHEVAHLLAFALYGAQIKAHGPQWKSIMQTVFKLPAERCHNYAITVPEKTFYIYQCACTAEHLLSIRRHNFVAKGYRYICKSCKTTLSFTQELRRYSPSNTAD